MMTKLPSQNSGESLQTALESLLTNLQSFPEGWGNLRQQVEDEVLNSKSTAVRKLIEAFGAHEIFLVIQEFWHPRFRRHLEALGPEPPQETVLCAFGQVEDNVVHQEGLDAFLRWAASQSEFNVQDILSKSVQSRNNVKDINEAIAAIVHFHRHLPALKVTVSTPELRAKVRKAFDKLNQRRFDRRCLGGAPAIISDVLAQLGVRVHLYTMYHSETMAALYKGRPHRLDLNASPPRLVCVNQSGTYQTGGRTYPHPTRSSYIFTYKEGHEIEIGGQSFTAQHEDRIIFRVYRYLGEHQEQWDKVRVKFLDRGQPTTWVEGPTVDPDEWPFFTGFVRWQVNNHTLEAEYLDKSSIEQLGDCDYIILNAPGLRAFQSSDPLKYLEANSIRQQLEWFAQGRAKIHLEISGGSDPLQDRFQPFAQKMRGLIHSLGINDGELLQLTDLPDFAPSFRTNARASKIYQRYERALQLAKELGVKRLYVHGNDVDLILRRGGSPGEMRIEIQADLFAKGIVVLAVLQRTIGDWRGYLQADYAIALAQDIIEEAKETLKKDIQVGKLSSQERRRLKGAITRAKKTLSIAEGAFRAENFSEAQRKAERAQGTIERAFGIIAGPGRATISLSPVLLAKGFEALIEFAYDFVRFTLSSNNPNSPSGLTKEGEGIFQRIIETGYHVTNDPGGYSVAVVPVMWPQLPIELNPTGAGDICSGVTAVYSGF